MPSSRKSSITFACLGDTRSGTESFDTDHRAVVKSIMRHTAPLFVLHAGDLIDAAKPGAWEMFFQIQSPLLRRCPMLPVRGNSDVSGEELSRMFMTGPAPWYAVSRGPVYIIGLDILYRRPKKYYDDYIGPDSEQYRWLTAALRSEERGEHPFTVVVFHAPLFTPDNRGCVPAADILVPLFEDAGVDAVVNAGLHYFSHARAGGVSYLITGGGGAALERARNTRAREVTVYESLFHHLRMSVRYPVLEIEAIDNRGTIFFSHAITCRDERPPPVDRDGDGTPVLTVFGTSSCGECLAFRKDVVPALLAGSRQCSLTVQFVDVDSADNYKRYVELEKRAGLRRHIFPVVQIGARLMSGDDLAIGKLTTAIDSVCAAAEEKDGKVLAVKTVWFFYTGAAVILCGIIAVGVHTVRRRRKKTD